MFVLGDKVRVIQRDDEYLRYPEGPHGDMRLAAEVWHWPGCVCSPRDNTPAGHHVVIFQHTCHYTLMTIPAKDLVHGVRVSARRLEGK